MFAPWPAPRSSGPETAHIAAVGLHRQLLFARCRQRPARALLRDQFQRGEFIADGVIRKLRAPIGKALQTFRLRGGEDEVGCGHASAFVRVPAASNSWCSVPPAIRIQGFKLLIFCVLCVGKDSSAKNECAGTLISQLATSIKRYSIEST